VEAKFALLQWHERARLRLLGAVAAAAGRSDAGVAAAAIRSLAELRVALRGEEMARVADAVRRLEARGPTSATGGAVDAFAALCVSQGDRPRNDPLWQGFPPEAAAGRRAAEEGPAIVPAITPSRESPWTLARILASPGLGDYARDEEGRVVYRGIAFTPGDIFLVNLANPSEGLFTVFAGTPNYSYHAALYVEIESGDRRIPCVYESYEHGTRVVPLCTYLSASHTMCVEVLRWRQRPAQAASRLSAAVTAELGREHGFNLWLDTAHDEAGRYITCTSAMGFVLAAAGFPLPSTATPIDPGAGANLAALGAQTGSFFSPGDFLAMQELEPTGFVDNGRWTLYVAAAIANDWVHEQLSTRPVHPEVDGTYRFYRWGARTVLSRSFPSAVLLSVFGFTERTFPAGPADLLALVLRLEEELDAGVLAIEKTLRERPELFVGPPVFSIHGLVRSDWARGLAAKQLAPVARWFLQPAAR
jgi:hypothetical protein